MMNRAFQNLRCRLYFEAALPRLASLSQLAPGRLACLRGRRVLIVLRTRSGLRLPLAFRGGHISVEEPEGLPLLELLFNTDEQANRTFMGRPALPPMPVRGLHRLGQARLLKDASAELDRLVKPGARVAEPEQGLAARLIAEVALAALPVLARHEPKAREAMRGGPHGLALFSVAGDFRAWVRVAGDETAWGLGKPPGTPRVHVRFADSGIAYRAFNNKLDTQAAIGRGELGVEGYVPLADHLDRLMVRLQEYLG